MASDRAGKPQNVSLAGCVKPALNVYNRYCEHGHSCELGHTYTCSVTFALAGCEGTSLFFSVVKVAVKTSCFTVDNIFTPSHFRRILSSNEASDFAVII